jgi:catechol 2,3-dioxygenase-like lactoylglutathione lyase family enzyme
MALHRLLGMEVGVPAPSDLDAFYGEIGLEGGNGKWGSEALPGQIRICEAPYRQLRELRVGCEGEEDLSAIAGRLEGLGVKSRLAGGVLRVQDPLNPWHVVVEPAEPFDVPAPPARVGNRPGERPRRGERAEVILETAPRPPRRLGHVVIGTPEVAKTKEFFVDGLGFRISDIVAGIAFFTRCSMDHHNFLISPGPVPYLNHYALEHDDIDAVARAASVYLRAHSDRQIDGPGRHWIGGNVFWYMRDPSGTFFEYFADMDVIDDDEAWQVREDWDLEDAWSIWGNKDQPEVFFQPDDMEEVIAGYQKENR